MAPSALGVGAILLLFVTALIGTNCIIAPAFLLFFFNNVSLYQSCTRFLEWWWLTLLSFLVENAFGVEFRFSGDWDEALAHRGESAVVISNHNNRLDWMFLFSAFLRLDALVALKIILKSSLKSIPGMGWAMQGFLFIFLERQWEIDQAHLASMFECVCLPVLFLFVAFVCYDLKIMMRMCCLRLSGITARVREASHF